MVHQAHGSCEILNELLQAEAKGDAIAKVDTTGGAAGGQEAKVRGRGLVGGWGRHAAKLARYVEGILELGCRAAAISI